MEFNTRLSNSVASFGLWLAQNPSVVRTALVALPLLLALGAALLTSGSVYACPAGSGGSCGE